MLQSQIYLEKISLCQIQKKGKKSSFSGSTDGEIPPLNYPSSSIKMTKQLLKENHSQNDLQKVPLFEIQKKGELQPLGRVGGVA